MADLLQADGAKCINWLPSGQDLFVRDIVDGIAGTGVKAAILKCATEAAGLTPGVERVVRAVAQAHRRTGVPI